MRMKLPLLAAAAVFAFQASALALPATVTTDVPIRLGPGPHYPVIGVVDRSAIVEVEGCVDRALWCQISWRGHTGWTYASFLAHDVQGRMVALPEARTRIEIPTVVYYEQQASTGPIAERSDVPGILGTLTIPLTPPSITAEIAPAEGVEAYVMANRVEPIYLEGEAVIDATLPNTVQLYEIPNYRYRYAYVNGQVVLADPATYRIVHVYR